MDIKNQFEKTLKNFLKKKIKITAGLVVAFLITGLASMASSADLASQADVTKDTLLASIAAQKAQVEELLKENEAALKAAKENFLTTLKQADFYSKPVYGSTQIFFNYAYENNGKMKDRTKSAWKDTYEKVKNIIKTTDPAGIQGLDQKYIDDYNAGNISADKLADIILKQNNGIVSTGKPGTTSVDLGVNITPLSPEIPAVAKDVQVNVAAPATPNVTVTSPTITAPALNVTFSGVTPPAIPPTPSVSVAVTAPGSVSTITPASVTPPTISVSPSTPIFEPLNVAIPVAPTGPSTPEISVLTPPSISFNGTGFGQGFNPSVTKGSLVLENWATYNTTALVNIVSCTAAETGISVSGGTVNVVDSAGNTNSLAPYSNGSTLTAFISDAADHDVIINGDYDMQVGPKGNTGMFVSLNPYETGHNKTTDNVYDFHGTLTMHGDEVPAGDTTCVLGFEHQLLANNGGGSGHFPNVDGGIVTSILKNTGTIDLNSGYNMVGIQIDTEYNNGVVQGFKKTPQTINDGTIKISSGARNSVAMDYGFYVSASPNSKVYLGDIVIEGKESYGLRMKDYTASGVPAYYNLTTVTGSKSDGTDGLITVKGSENIGVALFQGPTDSSTATTTAATAMAKDPTGAVKTYDDPSDILSNLSFLVGGSSNVGFYRDFVNNPNKMVITAAKIKKLEFDTDAAKSALLRSDNGEIETNLALTIGTVGEQNSVYQAGGTGTVTNKGSITTTALESKFFGMTAGQFPSSGSGSSGATITNDAAGSIAITGTNSIAMAVDVGNTGKNAGTLSVTGEKGAAVYNLGTFNLTGGTLLADGKNSATIFNKGALNITGTPTITADNGATGFYSDGTGTVSGTLDVTVNNTSNGPDRGVGLYTKGTGSTPVTLNNSVVTVNDGSAGVVSDGTALSLQNSTITYNNNSVVGTDDRGYAIYTTGGGTIDLSNANITVSGNSVGIAVDLGGGSPSVTLTGATLTTTAPAIGISIKNANSGLNISAIETDIATATGLSSYAPSGIIAIVDGGKLFLDSPLIEEAATAATDPGNKFYKRLQMQRLNITVGENKAGTAVPNVTVSATETDADATTYHNGQVVGIQSSSSVEATNNTDVQINLKNNATVIADRLDGSGVTGGVGLYANYGTVNIENGSKVKIETGDGVGIGAVPTGTPNTLYDEGVGVYGVNGTVINNDGEITVAGNKGVGIAGSAYRKLAGGISAGAEFGGKVGEGTVTINNSTNGNVISTGDGSVGIYAENNGGTSAIINNAGTVTTDGSQSVGIYGDGANIITTGTIVMNGTSGTSSAAIYGINGTSIDAGGTIKIGPSGVAVMPADNATATNTSVTTALTFTDSITGDTTDKIGFYYNGVGNVNFGAASGSIDATTLTNGIVVYVNGANITSTLGSMKLDGSGVGIYVDGSGNTVDFTTALDIDNGAIGIYSNGNNTVANATVTAKHNGSVGVYSNGGVTLQDITTISQDGGTGDSVIGVYGNGGTITVVDGNLDGIGLTLQLGNVTTPGADFGTGMYMTGGANVTGDKIALKNNSTSSNVGIYYSSAAAHDTDIEFLGNNTVGIFADGSIAVTNAKQVIYGAANTGNIGAYVSGGATYTQSSTTDTIDSANSAGLLAGNGTVDNAGTLTVSNGASVGVASMGVNAGDVAIAKNSGTIVVNSGAGMLAGAVGYAGTSQIVNDGTITVNSGVGAALKGATGILSGSGVVNASAGTAGIYLEDTGAGQTSGFTGSLNISSGAVGVFANRSVVDFPVTLGASSNGGIGVYATGTTGTPTNLMSDIDSSASDSTVGVYIDSADVIFNNNTITAGTSTASSGVGVYLANIIPSYTFDNATAKAASSGSVALYAGAVNTILGSNAIIDTTGGAIGVYVPGGSTLETQGGTLNIDNGMGIVLETGSIGNVGTAGPININFGANGGTAIYNNGGTLNLGTMVNVTGAGSLVATQNGNLSSGATLTVDGSTALLGLYTAGGPYTIENTSTGVINVLGGGVGLGALGTAGAATVSVINNGIIDPSGTNASGTPSIGIYTSLADIQNNNIINVGADGVGIYADGTGQPVVTNQITLGGNNAIGIAANGTIGNITNTQITGTNAGDIGVYLENAVTGAISAGNIALGDESVGIVAKGATTAAINGGNITVGNSGAASAVGIMAEGGATVNISGGTAITVGDNAIAVAAKDAGTSVTGVDQGNITLGMNGVYLYAGNGGSITLAGTGPLTANGGIGIMIDGSGAINNVTSIDVYNGGVGAYFIGAASSVPVINVYAGTASAYSIGAYYKGVSSVTLPTINQSGSYTIGAVLEGTSATMTSPINIANAADTDQIGIMAKGDASNIINVGLGNVSVVGDKNIGVYGEYANITTGDITLGTSSASSDKSLASIGVYAKNGGINSGNVTVGDNSMGLYAEGLTPAGLNVLGNLNVSNAAVGAYATGSGTYSEAINISGGMTVANNGAIGVYGKGTDINVNPSAPVTIGNGTSVGVVSEGDGNVAMNGSVTVADKGSSTGSIAVYKKDGSGNVNTSGTWSVGESGYGIYATAGTGNINVANAADMTLGMSGIGIYANGSVNVSNTGNITVGETYLGPLGDHADLASHQNSLAMYLKDGATAVNTATITVKEDHSVGVYGIGAGTYFENQGTIEVDKGGVGIFVKGGASALNSGTINLGYASGDCGQSSVGMAAYLGSSIVNGATGTINVGEGIGLLVATGATLDNQGVVNVVNGVGIQGTGTVLNQGTINVLGAGSQVDNSGAEDLVDGSVTIKNDGTVIIGNTYITKNGNLTASTPIELNGPYVDITNFGSAIVPLFTAPTIDGNVNLASNFATIGNGYYWDVANFASVLSGGAVSTVTVSTSPMFIPKVASDGSLIIVKRPYSDSVIGDQNDALYNGLDSLLKNDPTGTNNESVILKDLNAYLDGLYASDPNEYYAETSRTLAETRGDIYATIQTRMQDIQKSFDDSFEELVNSYNFTKDTGKFSVMYTQGGFDDDTVGIDDYDYRVQGLMYMKEYDGRRFDNKWGFDLGFAVSNFKFDDAQKYDSKSKEDVYSVRAGLHSVWNFNSADTFRLVSRLELGYNRHEAKRKLELDKLYTNKAKYDTYQVTLDNRFEKTLYRSLKSKIDLYAGVDLEYGKINGFSETGDGVYLQVKDNDYFSIQPNVGINGQKRVYLGNKLSMKLFGDLNYAYELGEFYDNNKARIKNGTEGYYDLVRPEKEEGIFKGKVGVGIEKANHYGLTVDVEVRKHNNKKDADVRYNIRANYKF